jgi:hypothetical protein
VVIGDLDDGRGHGVAADIDGLYQHADVTIKDDVDALFQAAGDRFGTVDIAFNNAGISPLEDGSILETDLAAWSRVQQVNLTSVYLCCKAALPFMLRQQRGSIINTASFVAVLGSATRSLLPASKGGVLAISRGSASSSPATASGSTRCALGRSTHRCCNSSSPPIPSGRPVGGAHPNRPVRRAGRDRQRRAFPRLRRGELHHGEHIPG